MKQPIIGVAGTGLIAREHAQSFAQQGLLDQLVVFDVRHEQAEAFARDVGGRPVKSEEELVDAADIVWICSPPNFHRAIIEKACHAGKTIFCEKPLALKAEDVRAIEAAVATSGVTFYMGHSGRWSDPFRRMRQLVADGMIGDPVEVWSRRLGYLDPSRSPAWRLDDAASGGVVIELGVHEIDFIRWVGGNWLEVAARGSSRCLAPGRFLDTVSAVGELAGGANGQLSLSWAEPRYLWQRGVVGTTGSLFIDDMRFTQLEHWQPGKTEPTIIEAVNWRHPDTGENMAFREQLAGVLAAWRRESDFPVKLADGAAAVRAAIAMRDSIATGATVKVEPGS